MNHAGWKTSLALALLAVLCLTLARPAAAAPAIAPAAVHARFDLATPKAGPFPSDRFTVADRTQLTGRRVNLPEPDPAERPSDWEDIQVINTLDGFNLQPRLSVPFDGPIDVNSVTSRSVFLVRLGSTVPGGPRGSQVIGINQIVWDPQTNTLHVESDELLEQHTRYGLIVTSRVRDHWGRPLLPSVPFLRFLLSPLPDPAQREYRWALLEALQAVYRAGVRDTVVSASVFTTQSVTAVLEKMRDQIKAATPAPADFNLGPEGARTVFALDAVTGITWRQQTGTAPAFTTVGLNLGLLRLTPGAVGRVAFGRFLSPDYEVHPGEYIPPVGTRTGAPAVQGTNEIYFNLFLPPGPAPAGGWPVAIFGPGAGGNKNQQSLFVAASMARHGIATIAINAVGHGFGPLGTLTVNQSTGEPVTLPDGGRGIDLNGDRVISATAGVLLEEFDATNPWRIIWHRDTQRQTVADLMQLARVIQVGMDVDGDGSPELDPSRIYYVGVSFGGSYGTQLLAVEPSVRAGSLIVPLASSVEAFRLSPFFRPVLGNRLAARVPSLINAPGLTSIGGVPVAAPHFNENLPPRNQPPVINTVPGAIAIQELFEHMEWVMQSGDALAYAPHLRKAPLAGVRAKSVLIQFARGDQAVPNPMTTALLRAGDLAEGATFYRHDRALAEDITVPQHPHLFLYEVNSTISLMAAIARGAQEQIAVFFASDASQVIHPEPVRFFEVPIRLPLPEDLGFLP